MRVGNRWVKSYKHPNENSSIENIMKSKSIGLWVTALCPLMLVIMGIAYGFAREYKAWAKVRQQVMATVVTQRQWNQDPISKPSGLTVDQKSIDSKICQVSPMAQLLYAEYSDCEHSTSPDSRLRLIGPESDWPEAPLVKRFAEDAEPFIENIEELFSDDTKSNGKLLLDRYPSTDVRIENILELYFRYSFYNRDHDKAKRALMVMGKLVRSRSTDINAQDQKNDLVGFEQIYSALSGTLRFDFWTSQELDDLSRLILKPLDIHARLQASKKHLPELFALHVAQACNPQGFGIDDNFETVHRTMGIDSFYLARLFEASRIDDGIQDEGDLTKSIPILNRPWLSERGQIPSTGIFSVSLPMHHMGVDERSELTANARLAYELGALEDIRRTTLLAVSIKKFQIQEKRWPTSLKELSTVDENLHLNNVDGNPIEYYAPRGNVVAGAQVSNVTSSFLTDKLLIWNNRHSVAMWLTKYYSLPLSILIK